MEGIVDNVVKKFEEAERNVENIESRLEANFSAKLAGNHSSDMVDKASLLQELNEVKQSYAEIKNEARELGNLQREMAIAFQKDLLSTVQKLQALTDSGTVGKVPDEVTKAAIESLVEQSNLADALTNKLKSPKDT